MINKFIKDQTEVFETETNIGNPAGITDNTARHLYE
jgi:hypothetical protein